jgi:putative ABC transport system permease protein
MLSDLRFALRLWRKTPSLLLLALVALGLGIGATTFVFSVVRAVLLRPLPYPAPDGLVMVWEANIPRNRDRNVVSPGNFIHWRERQRSFTDLGLYSFTVQINLTGLGEPREIAVQGVTPSTFDLLGVKARLGRTFLRDEERPNATVAVVSDGFWRSALQSDAGAIGRAINVGGRDLTVVGVMPPAFAVRDSQVDVWTVIGLPPEARTPRGRGTHAIGRLKPGVGVAQAQAEMTAIAAALTREYPGFNTGWTVNVVPLQEDMVGRTRTPLLVLFGAIALVLLIACANVANLLLAQASGRQRELAVRTALGGTRGRLVRQLLVESTTLALAGGLAGAALAWTGIRLLNAFPLERLPIPRLTEVTLDAPVVLFALGVALLTGVLFGAMPALTASAVSLHDTLKEGTRGAGVRRGARTRALLVTAEIALSVVLLTGSGLLIRSFIRVMQTPLGFETTHVLTTRVNLPAGAYPEDHQRLDFFARALEDIRVLPGVTAAGAISFLPLTGVGAATSFMAVDKPTPALGEHPVTDVRVISGDYFAALRIPLQRGRTFDTSDAQPESHTLIVNETLARTMWPGQDPIGRQLRINWGEWLAPDTVVGVVGDARHDGAQGRVRPMIYWPHSRGANSRMIIVARTHGDPAQTAAALAARVRALNRNLPLPEIETMEQVLATSVRERRLIMTLLAVFAALAVVLAAVGIYSVMAYSVGQRTHEIGVRLAIGASRGDVLRMVLRQTIALTAAGLVIGVAAAAGLTRLMRTLLFETPPGDPVTLAAVVSVLVVVAAAAGYVPGRRAARVDPIVALRYE